MRSLRQLVLVTCAAATLPVWGQSQTYTREPSGRTEILADITAHRAYIPFGTVLPPGLEVRVKVSRTSGALNSRRRSVVEKQVADEQPLVFEYAPESRFEEARKHNPRNLVTRSQQLRPKTLDDRICYPISLETTAEGVAGTYYAWFDFNQCTNNPFPQNGILTDDYTAYTYPEDETQAQINDDRGHYACWDTSNGYSSTSCNVSYTGHFTNPITCNHVIATGYARHIEWLDNYVPNYLGFFFDVRACDIIQ
jgi:hypothetical protein